MNTEYRNPLRGTFHFPPDVNPADCDWEPIAAVPGGGDLAAPAATSMAEVSRTRRTRRAIERGPQERRVGRSGRSGAAMRRAKQARIRKVNGGE